MKLGSEIHKQYRVVVETMKHAEKELIEKVSNQTKAFIEESGGWRAFYDLGERKRFFKHISKELKDIGPLGVLTGSLQAFSGLAEVIKKHTNKAYFLHYVYLGVRRGIADHVLMNASASRGALNRFSYIFEIVGDEIHNFNATRPLRIINLGGGFGFLDNVILGLYKNVQTTVVDINTDVIQKGKAISELNGVCDRIAFHDEDARKYIEENDPCDVLITMGIIDYMEIHESIEFLKGIRRGIVDDGTIIVTAVGPHIFNKLARIFGLAPIYKTKNDVDEILKSAGYRDVEAVLEPSGTSTIARGRK